MELWEQVKERLAARLTWESYQNWVARTSQRTQEGQRLVVVVPNQVTRDWLEKELGEDVRSALRELKAGSLEVVYTPGGGEAVAEPAAVASGYGAGGPESLFGGPVGSLNERYTFESFVVGSCNQFAHAASRAVAEMPARTYNPLFIYGGVGMGKTHLIHAIGHELLKRAPNLRIVYTSSERFMNQLITCIRTDRMSLFHQHTAPQTCSWWTTFTSSPTASEPRKSSFTPSMSSTTTRSRSCCRAIRRRRTRPA